MLATFSHLQDQFNLPKGDFYKYLQLRHWIVSSNVSSHKEPCFPKAILAKLQSSANKGRVSRWYQYITLHGDKGKLPAQVKWKTDLSKALSEEEWSIIFRSCFKVSRSVSHSEMFYKPIQRVYYTPERLQNIWPSTSKYCWRNCGWHPPCLLDFRFLHLFGSKCFGWLVAS